MDAASWVALSGSVLAAVTAWAAARNARKSADGIDRRRHMVEAIDAESESFTSAFAEFGRAAGLSRTAEVGVGPALFAAEVLMTHPRTSGELREALGVFCDTLTDATVLHRPAAHLGPQMDEVRRLVLAARGQMASERAEAVRALDRPWWRSVD